MTDDGFWARPELAHIHTFARSRLVCPWATLGVALVRAACTIPTHVNIPPITGSEVAPNLFCNLVGPSGMGKDSAKAACLDAVVFQDRHGVRFEPPDFAIGSGEGIAKTFDQSGHGTGDKDDEDDDDAQKEAIHTAIFSSSEIERLSVLTARRGATIESVIRQLYNGESIGFTNAGKDTRTHVPRLSYRAGLLFGVQPLKAGWLLAGEDGGTPQRFTWMPVQDRGVPDTPPPEPEPLRVKIPAWPSTTHHISVPKSIWQLVQDNRRAQHRGEVDAIDGHRLLNRLKIAAALMALAGRTQVDEDDWTLAGTIMAISDQTREACTRAAQDKARQMNRDRAAGRLAIEDYAAASKHRRAKERIREQLSKLALGETIRRNKSRHALRIDIRDYWEAAMAELVEDREASEVDVDGHTEYLARTGYGTYPPPEQQKRGGYGPYPVRTESGSGAGQSTEPASQAKTASNGAARPDWDEWQRPTPPLDLLCPGCDNPKPLRPHGPGGGMCEECAVDCGWPASKPIEIEEDSL